MRVGVFGYDLKFIRPLVAEIEANHPVAIRAVESGSLHAFPTDEIAELVEWSDVVVAEFFGPYVEKIAAMQRNGQPLVVRLHRFELHRGFADTIDPGSLAAVICVNEHYASALSHRTGFPRDCISVVPNAIDTVELDRAKSEAASKTVGFLGASSQRKRLDLALDVIELVRQHVPNAVLSIKSEQPENLKWVMDDPAEREYFEGLRPRLDEALANGAVLWDPHGPNVAGWFTGVGYTLSTSDDESFHMAPAEGMASGTVPVVRRWPGADTVYDARWLFEEVADAASGIVGFMTGGSDLGEAEQVARSQAEQFAVPVVADQWFSILSAALSSGRTEA